jgi:hypothetical protein
MQLLSVADGRPTIGRVADAIGGTDSMYRSGTLNAAE